MARGISVIVERDSDGTYVATVPACAGPEVVAATKGADGAARA